MWGTTLAGNYEPLALAERPQLQMAFETPDAHVNLHLYAAFVCGVHERLAALFTLLTLSEEEW